MPSLNTKIVDWIVDYREMNFRKFVCEGRWMELVWEYVSRQVLV